MVKIHPQTDILFVYRLILREGGYHVLKNIGEFRGNQPNLLVENFKALWKAMNISLEEVVMDGPFFQNPTVRQPGCQIDYLIQTRFHSLYLCEVKFSKNPVRGKIIEEMEEKRKRLCIPKTCSYPCKWRRRQCFR